MKIKIIISAIFTGILTVMSCGVVDKGDSLTDEQVLNYIKVYKKMREAAPGMLEKINQNPDDSQAGKEGFNNFENIIKDGGLKDYPQFVMLNAKIGSIFSIMQATEGMDKFSNMNESSKNMLDEVIAEYQKIIDDPEMPEETKNSARQGIEELKKSKKELSENWEKNKFLADFVLNQVKKISGLIVDEADIEVVKHHEKEIMEAYVGFPMPELPDGKMPKLNLDMN